MNPAKLPGPTTAARDPSAAWLNPELVTILAPMSYKDHVVSAGVPTQVLTPNPRRIAVAFITSLSTADGTFVSPFADPQTFGVPVPSSTRLVSFAVDDVFSMLREAWYVYHASGATVRVVEFVRPT